jgi:quercetin dioxygenase-like cupin family protein
MSTSKLILTTLLLSVTALAAQQPAFKRTELQRGDLSVAGREVVTAKAEFPVGAQVGKHTHFGEEIGYLAEGTVSLEIEGMPARTLKAGEAFLIPNGKVHNAINTGSGQATVIASYVVEKGKPLATPVK